LKALPGTATDIGPSVGCWGGASADGSEGEQDLEACRRGKTTGACENKAHRRRRVFSAQSLEDFTRRRERIAK
jgi:hypothetical protein